MDKPNHPILVEFHDYWRQKKGRRAMPARADIDPIEIPQLLPYAYIVDVHTDPLDFSYRLLGSDVLANTARNYTGRRLSEIAHEGTQGLLRELYTEVYESGLATFDRILYVTKGKTEKFYENAILPLSDGGGAVGQLIGCAVHLEELADEAATIGLVAVVKTSGKSV